MLQFGNINLVASANKLFMLTTENLASVERNFPKVDSGNILVPIKTYQCTIWSCCGYYRLCLKNEKSAYITMPNLL